MLRILLKTSLAIFIFLCDLNLNAQCPILSCPADIVVGNDSSTCDAVVFFNQPVGTDPCSTSGSQTFIYTGTEQTFMVPAGVTSINVDAYGAQGGSNWASNTNYGGRVQADLPVVPGSTIYIYIGEQATSITGGWNGGGNGESAGAGGGGASDIRIGGNTINERMIVAGGAGGGGYWSGTEIFGGLGGGLIGGPGYRGTPATPGGDPGTQTSSANGTCVSMNNPICAGGFGYGGAPSGCGCEGYGGGGGWYGGGGSGNCRGGGGGSSYTDPGATNVTHTQGIRPGNGEIILTWNGGGTATITQTSGLISGSVFPLGTTTNAFIMVSGGSTTTCSFDVTVTDTEAPSIICHANLSSCDATISGLGAISDDNCGGETVMYNLSGATSGSGFGDASGTFNLGTTTVMYTVTDPAGNSANCSFDVTVNPPPNVLLADYSSDTICTSDLINLPAGTPAGGIYTGPGVSGTNFDPSVSGIGTFWTTYNYTDAFGCSNSDSTQIVVTGCADVLDNELDLISVFPNPTKNYINIAIGGHQGNLNYSLISIEGRVIQEAMGVSESTITIDCRKEGGGVYLLNISDGNSSKTFKIIKQ